MNSNPIVQTFFVAFLILGTFCNKNEDHHFTRNVEELIKAIKARNPSTCRSNSPA